MKYPAIALFATLGIAPAQAEQIKNLGTHPPKTPDGKPNPAFNPFENLTEQQIQTLPDGAWFRMPDGKVYRRDYRKKPPPGAASPQSAEANLDDQEAMAGNAA